MTNNFKKNHNKIHVVANEIHTQLINQLKELKQRVEGLYKSVHGIAPDQADKIWKQLNELKEQIDGAFNIEHDDSLPTLIYKNREVLREFINEVGEYLGNDRLEYLLEKLDIGKTEKKELVGIKHDPEYLDQFTTEASGGEKKK